MRIFIVAMLLCVAAAAVSADPGPAGAVVPCDKHIINLDLAPEDRWTAVIDSYQSSRQAIIDYFSHQLPAAVMKILEVIMGDLDKYLGEYGVEMRSVAKAYGVDLGIIVGLNFAYELRKLGGPHPNVTSDGEQYHPKACTSIVTYDTDNKVFHGRNLDWNTPENLRNITFTCEFQRGGKTVFVGACMAGFVGVLTGMVPGGFSVSINERLLGGSPIVDALNAIVENGTSVSHLTRRILETETTYNDALRKLVSTDVSAPVYYITAGITPNEGAVISRDRTSVDDIWVMPNTYEGPEWFVLNTNYDHWLPDPPLDSRATYGKAHMAKLGQTAAACAAGLKEVLHTWPVGNNATAQTVIMSPATSYFQAYYVHT